MSESPRGWRRLLGVFRKKSPPDDLSPPGPPPGPDSLETSERGARWAAMKTRLTGALQRSTEKTGTLVRGFDWSKAAGWAQGALQKRGGRVYGRLLTLGLCAWFLADVSVLFLEGLIPEPSPLRASYMGGSERPSYNPDEYTVVWTRNLFNSKGLLPGEEGGLQDPGGTPVRTSLPFTLVGAIIARDELRSIATIEDKSASQVYPVMINDEIPSKAKILKIEANKVIFLNTSSGRREFVDIPEDPNAMKPISIMRTSALPGAGGGKGKVEQIRENQFQVSRTAVDAALADFNQVLTQARAVPHFENGMPAGYKLYQIVPGSIYAQLGLQNGDQICGMNGDSINDPAKAFELLGQLKSGASHLELCVKRNNQTKNMVYDIK